jgi:hypothetical protein
MNPLAKIIAKDQQRNAMLLLGEVLDKGQYPGGNSESLTKTGTPPSKDDV